MKKYMLKTILFIVCHLASNNMFCTEVDQGIQLFNIGTRFYSNCQNNAKNIEEYLQDFDRAELHLFWTSGRDPEILQKEEIKPQIQIGGSTYANLFPVVLSAFLKYSPENSAVCLVLDSVTQKSNQLSLKLIQDQFPSRFHISNIDTVIDNIVKAFPKYEHTIKTVFANATQGNPAIASDVYRLIGMMYGRNPTPAQLNRILLTYCDVDTFCYGLQHDDHTQLISALFAPSTQWQDDLLYLSKPATTNDVIKLQVSDKSLPLYDAFCQRILDHLEKNLKSADVTILNYFLKLHDLIVNNQKQTCDDKFITDYLSKFQSLQVQTNDIIYVTGPWFLRTLHDFIILDDFPSIKSFQWHPGYELERLELFVGKFDRYMKSSPIRANFEIVLLKYVHTIVDALYLCQNYGKNLSAYQQIVKFLAKEDNFPYRHPDFKKCLEDTYKDYREQYEKLMMQSNYIDSDSDSDSDLEHIEYESREYIYSNICESMGFHLPTPKKLDKVIYLPVLKYYLNLLDIKIIFPTQADVEYLQVKINLS